MASLEQHLFEHALCAHMIFSVGPSGELNLALCNESAAAFYGLDRNALQDKSTVQIFGDSVASFFDHCARLCLQRQAPVVTAPGDLPSSFTAQTQNFTINPLFDSARKITHIDIGFLPDETARLELQRERDEALNASRAKSTFLAGMSHELRTPLNAILGFSELIRSELFGPLGHAKYAEYMNDIHFAAGHLLEIINDVLDMSKIEAGKFELHEQDVDMTAMLNSVARIMSDRATSARIFIRAETDPGVEVLHADQRVLRQMLFNLISNAIKFSPVGGTVTLRAYPDPETGRAFLSVQDHGIGMEPHDIARMLEPFAQDRASTRTGIGTGLGLPLT
ncbi:MAG: pleC, partial [Alphaproteobacteria bacterium]|nr:pleC [Alphaproteobacteria bacterium]